MMRARISSAFLGLVAAASGLWTTDFGTGALTSAGSSDIAVAKIAP